MIRSKQMAGLSGPRHIVDNVLQSRGEGVAGNLHLMVPSAESGARTVHADMQSHTGTSCKPDGKIYQRWVGGTVNWLESFSPQASRSCTALVWVLLKTERMSRSCAKPQKAPAQMQTVLNSLKLSLLRVSAWISHLQSEAVPSLSGGCSVRASVWRLGMLFKNKERPWNGQAAAFVW